MHRKLRVFQTVVVILALSQALSAAGHELEEGAHGKNWSPKRAAFMPFGRKAKVRPSNVLLPQYVIALPNRWAIGQNIRVCFQGGDAPMRARILTAAAEWFKYVNLKLLTGGPNGVDCEMNSKFEIRIGFDEPGNWSYIGHDSLNSQLVTQNLTSMNLEAFDTSPPSEPIFTGLVLHEFGHALGFEHEHQSPASGCDQEYDWKKLYAFYWKTYRWDKVKVDENIKQLMTDHSAYGWSQFDPDSIMIYGTKPEFLFKGTSSKCYLHDNSKLSHLDVQGAQVTYRAGDAAELLGARIEALTKSTRALPAGALKDSLSRQLQLSRMQLTDFPNK